MRTQILFFIIIISFMTSCRPVHKEPAEFTNNEWNTTEKVNFRLSIEDPGEYDINVKVYYTDQMQGTYFAIGLMLKAPFGEERYLERSEKIFKNGEATGEKNKEGYYVYEMELFKEINCVEEGVYKFEAQSLMPTHTVKGIHKLELLVKPV
ncbi:MAG: hypothetical protein K9I29_04315 [Bacteroidales bacterium]|nr:hypothetical protein [Bacteroidales bacterium]MCF8327497.1 hypothetical protein [Bacteroidales bacterium]